MFFLNWGARGGDLPDDAPHGLVLLPSGLSREDMLRRSLPTDEVEQLLIDPQLYLADLAPDDCQVTCARLVSYPWFTDESTDFDSGEMNRREWQRGLQGDLDSLWAPVPDDRDGIRRRAAACVQFQAEQGVTSLVLPAPVCNDAGGDFSQQLEWLRIGMEEATDSGVPALATLCFSQACMSVHSPEENPLLQVVAENVSQIDGLEGVYLTVDVTGRDDARVRDLCTAESLLYLSQELGRTCGLRVVVNFADMLGFACLGAGADAFATGYFSSRKRLSLNDLAERSGGRAYPKFYSHATVSDYLPQRDLVRVRDEGLLRYLAADQTPYSEDLFDVLSTGDAPDVLPRWAETINNTTAARLHFLSRVRRAVDGLPADTEDRRLAIMEWLQDAERDVEYLERRFDDDPLEADFAHVRVWRAAYQRIVM